VLLSNYGSRRRFLAGRAAPLAARAAADQNKDKLPLVSKRLEKAFLAPGNKPNALQAVPDGLWILDQESPNKVHKVRYQDGSVLVDLLTESQGGSGITYGDGALWIASTLTLKILKVDPKTGKTLASFDTPGAGKPRFGPPRGDRGAHGLEWVNGKYWVAVPPADAIYQIEPNTGKVLHRIPGPGTRSHGLAWADGHLWCVETFDRAIYKIDPTDGRLVAKIQITKQDPGLHGLTYAKGVFWYCDADSHWVCRLV